MGMTAKESAQSGLTFLAKKAKTAASFAMRGSTKNVLDDNAIAARSTDAINNVIQQVNNTYQKNAAVEAEMRQGSLEAVNAVDNANKRSKFMKFLFGEDAGYSTAVGIATKNNAQNMYLQELNDVDNFVHLTPEEYSQHMNDKRVAEINELYKDDPEATKIAMTQWAAKSANLAAAHTAKHMVWAQEQTHQEGVRDALGVIDESSILMDASNTPELVSKGAQELSKLFAGDYRYVAPDGSVATPEASKAIQVTAISEALANGNMFVMKGLPEGFENTLSTTQRNKLVQAKQQYDNKIAQNGELIVEKGLLSLEMGSVQGMMQAITELNEQKIQLSGSTSSLEKWNEDKRRLLSSLNSLKDKLAKEGAEDSLANQYYRKREQGDAGGSGALWTKKRQDAADDMVVMNAATMIARDTGEAEPQSLEEAIDKVLVDKAAMTVVAGRVSRFKSVSPRFAEAIKQAVLNLPTDENGMVTPEGRAVLDNVQTLYRNGAAEVRDAIGEDASAMIEITMANRNSPWKEIEHKRNEYVKNRGVELTKADLGIPPDKTMRDYVKDVVGQENLDIGAAIHYEKALKTGFRIYNGDLQAAKNYVRQQMEYNNEQWRGNLVVNSKLSNVNVPEVLNHLEDTGLAQAIIATRLPYQDESNPVNGFSKLKDVQVEVAAANGDVIISSSQFSFPIVINSIELQEISKKAKQNKDAQRNNEEAAFRETMKQRAAQYPAWMGNRGE